MTILTPGTWKRIEEQAARFLHLPTRQIVDLLILFSERQAIPPHAINQSLNPLRAELRRRELRGFDDPFDSIHDPVTQ